jgi:transcriptional regulator with XRE-family HTH domain
MSNPKPVLDHEPEAVTWARKKAGLTKTAVANELGVALSLISQIESGKRNATPAMLLRLAEVFNCPVVVLERKRHPCVPADIRPPETNGKAA